MEIAENYLKYCLSHVLENNLEDLNGLLDRPDAEKPGQEILDTG